MTKRDDDPAAGAANDMEVGMTTAERRRRRRRGGGLRVPSDNVPRRTNPPVVAPVPEDPSLAMSIAYSFSSDSSEPVPRVTMETPVPRFDEPMAPEGVPTVIDPPAASAHEPQDFEVKTREMAAVDLEALGLVAPGERAERAERRDRLGIEGKSGNPLLRTQPGYASIEAPTQPDMGATDPSLPRVSEETAAQLARATTPPPVGVDVDLEATTIGGPPDPAAASRDSDPDVLSSAPPPGGKPAKANRERKERLKTMALTDEDLEEVREAVRAAGTSQPVKVVPAPHAAPVAPAPADSSASEDMWGERATVPAPAAAAHATHATPPPTPPPAPSPTPTPPPTPTPTPTTPPPLPQVVASAEPMSVPEIDIRELSDRSEFEVDVDVDDKPADPPPPPLPRAQSQSQSQGSTPPPLTPAPPVLPVGAQPPSTPPELPRSRPPSIPPPLAPSAAASQPGVAHPGATPPPPPAAAHKAPPSPPPAAKKAEKAAASAASKIEGKGARTKAWFAELFDEDYLRTLPFLTPQATQSEAEFVIDALSLQPGAQVLDIGCGYGRHAMELAARGFHVVGLDLSTPLLVRGGEEAHRRGLEINFVRGDMRELDFESQFDAAYCLFSTFGYFDDETNKRTIANVARALKPGGRVMLEILNRDYVIADLPTRVWWEGEGCVVLEEVELNYFSSRIQVNRSVVFDDGRQLEQEISVRAYSLHEVGKLMHAAGFRVLEVSGGYQTRGRFFGNQSRHIIVVAERKDSAAPQ